MPHAGDAFYASEFQQNTTLYLLSEYKMMQNSEMVTCLILNGIYVIKTLLHMRVLRTEEQYKIYNERYPPKNMIFFPRFLLLHSFDSHRAEIRRGQQVITVIS